ncbi:RtcB family protein [Aequorivita sp. H23M31]|uniref:3'-phosphate/5'-hydroxy nucleic acid ligase n=1 Tax=Aequorivita ciconiae TaxID=2494375 RepID=A0A410G5R7_9FLAO|nr:RtcB family protein [Aequorivita sp. H23M31]QAA82644.1 RtcB family protein [Aequorivita sp. H23M31]
MIQKIETEKIPIKLWLDDIEDGALQQAKDLANLDIAFRHIAIMPDSHQGYGMPIGGILATKDAIIPNAVGVDIGCGMCSLRTNLETIEMDELKNIMGQIRETVPVGFKHHDEKQDERWMPDLKEDLPIVSKEYERGRNQVGTLGGGNHFMEIQKGSDGYIWIMVHSGSRNIGYTVANHYHKKAVVETKKRGDDVPKDLSYFVRGTEDYDNYYKEMNYCIEFALQNRKLMMERIKDAFKEFVPEVEFSNFINKPHNFAAWETHFGGKVMVHRKGATRAEKGEWGMIPGSQGTSSFLVKGKGNPLSFNSCSHGAGRLMSRSEARRSLDLKKEVAQLKEKGVLHALRHKKDLDEAPSSYKNINEVMALQKDLVEIQVELTPLAVVKG